MTDMTRLRCLSTVLKAVGIALLLALACASAPASILAFDPSTGTPTPTSTSAPTAEPTTTPTSTSTPTSTATPKPIETPRAEVLPTPVPTRRPRRIRLQPTPTPTSTPTATPVKRSHPRRQHRKRHLHRHTKGRPTPTPTASPTATSTPTVTPTPTPPISLQAENSIEPVTCNGPAKLNSSRPFLYPPYRGWTSIVSYVDHDMPNFVQDGQIITATGLTTNREANHVASDFPAYWNASVRQYVYYDGHNGYDFNLSYQPVYAAAAGKVIYAAPEYADALDHGYGNMVMINHRNGYVTLYGHFSKILVKVGQKVKRGQELGISGNTGHSSGPHLHFTVFHNCTPTDPYGWTGSGPDPLASYQGETSTYLWVRPPLVVNPLPGLAGIAELPAPPVERLLLLRLPSTKGGPAAFMRALRAESRRVEAALGYGVRGVRLDALRGALDITVAVTPLRLYSLPDIVAIGSMDDAADARADVLAALARAALVGPQRSLHLSRGPSWTGYLFQWQGQTFLLGKGPRSKEVNLRFARGHKVSYHRLQADPSSGAYAVDLGKMSRADLTSLRRAIQGSPARHTSLSVQAIPVRKSSAKPTSASRKASQTHVFGTMLVAVLLIAALLAAAVALRTTKFRAALQRGPGADAGEPPCQDA